MSYDQKRVQFPDGTVGPVPPDGQVFLSEDGNMWTWDSMMLGWIKCYGGSHNHVKPGDFEYFAPDAHNREFECAPKCECGKEKHGFARHSAWCEKYEDFK